uniref:Uncharacterized protein n=1 Tax=Anguilla anguilla TaxID=7936 RepID=A0A0E9U195_ANGAN
MLSLLRTGQSPPSSACITHSINIICSCHDNLQSIMGSFSRSTKYKK